MHIQTLIHHYGYFGVFFILLMENIGIPFPAETTLTISGIEWTQRVFHLLPLIVAAAAGNVVGSSIAYGIGRFLGRPVVLRFGRFVGITEQRLDTANERFNRFEGWIVLFGKFIAGIRVLIPYLAGINGMSFGLFSLFNTVSAVVWAGFFIIVGKYVGIEWTRYHAVMHRYLLPTIVVAALLVSAYVAFHIWQRRRRRRPGPGSDDSDEHRRRRSS